MTFFDCHCHTEWSDCSEDVTLDMYARIARTTSASFAVTDHSAHLFYPPDSKWAFWGEKAEALYDQCYAEGLARCAQYVEALRAVQTGGMLVGVELDVLPDGRIVFDPELLGELDIVVGAVHGLRALTADLPTEAVASELKSRTLRLCEIGVDVLAHPFREWAMKRREIPDRIVEWLVDTATDAQVALELNCHYQVQDCDRLMLKLCAAQNARIAIATDTHRSREFGGFSYHEALLAEAGIPPDSPLLLTAEGCRVVR